MGVPDKSEFTITTASQQEPHTASQQEPHPPASPSAYDDEFDGSSTVSWLDTPTAATTKDIDSFSPGCLHLEGVGTGNNMIGVVQTAPGSFPYTITTRIVGRGAPVNYHRHGGIILCNGITSGSVIWYVGQVWEGAELHRAFSQTLGGSWIGGAPGWTGRESAKFERVTVTSASSATAYFSDDGYVWVAYNTFNPGFTPTHIGLGCSQENSGSIPAEATFGFFRVT